MLRGVGRLSTPPRLSADGLFYWDGSRWVPVQQPTLAAPPHLPTRPGPAPKTVSIPTSHTRFLQYQIVGFYVLVAVWWTVTTAVVAVHVPDFVTRFIAQQEALHPDQPLPPPGYDTGMDRTIFGGLAVIVVAVIGMVAGIVAGTVRRWTWMYYALLCALALQALWWPLANFDIIRLPDSLGGETMLRWGMIGFGAAAVFLFVQLLWAWITTEPWATRRPSSSQQ